MVWVYKKPHEKREMRCGVVGDEQASLCLCLLTYLPSISANFGVSTMVHSNKISYVDTSYTTLKNVGRATPIDKEVLGAQ